MLVLLKVLLMAVVVLGRATNQSIHHKDDIWEQYEALLSVFENEEEYYNQPIEGDESFPFPDCSKYDNVFEFTCDVRPSGIVPTSAHQVRPSDIVVIGAVGDSLTAANGAGACFVPSVLRQYRGVSWSIGGNDHYEKVLTLPNILKKFNSNLTGYSTGYGSVDSEGSRFNCAVPAARSEQVPEQTEKMIERILNSDDVDVDRDWKLVTLFIGGNDLCQYCKDRERSKAVNYVARIQSSLDMMMEKLPRTIVNVVGIVRVPEIVSLVSLKCDILHSFLCPCAIDITPEEEFEFVELTNQYQELLEELVMSGRYDTRDDFTVVYQPFLTDTNLPKDEFGKPDKTYFAPDCFHFGIKAHAVAAKELWNNMVISILNMLTIRE
ncbi:putative phospholipase B1, membrane-associated-like [Apostichopus japonicus]|uniref:Phospholipase B1, membrane-associated n=1 Tax=Stichopus japonicus TaxID=307972 RepID=A0A2G8L7A1_STIJA|nr:putative phospholipase B1, membrane-associated-like [Apostichopus japonicus]